MSRIVRGEENGTHYYAMELVDGPSRVELWKAEPRLWFDRIIKLVDPNYGKSMQPIELRDAHRVRTNIFHRHAPVRG